ncbi:MAG: hypothetical protein RBT59_01465 [Arcobacteraceae bacterium]|jgi:hypothetical protein|nr:hypothetical protein [Arcobacteraceae bacterium]
MTRVFEKNQNGLPDFFVYNGVGDSASIFSTPVRLYDFLAFMYLELGAYERKYQLREVEILPALSFKSEKAGTEFLSVDYHFFVQTVGRYLDSVCDRNSALKFITDFAIDTKKDKYMNAALVLFYSYFETYLGVLYINNVNKKTMVQHLQFSSRCVYQNEKIAVEFAALNFNVKRLKEYLGHAELIENIYELCMQPETKQVAYGYQSCTDYWEKSNKMKTYFFAKENISL